MLIAAEKSHARLEHGWSSPAGRRTRAALLVATLTGGVLLIELGRRGLTPEWLPELSSNHLTAIPWAITLLLIFEFVDMAFAMARSVADTVTRHLQVYALVLLRDAFLKLDKFDEPINITLDDLSKVYIMASDAGGAVALFIAAVVFSRMQRHAPLINKAEDSKKFINIKRTIALLLLGSLAFLCANQVVGFINDTPTLPAIATYFTLLVFADVLLAFVSMAFAENPAIVFRNFGFAFAAILLRLALTAPEYVRPSLGIAAALVAIAVTFAYNLSPDPVDPDDEDAGMDQDDTQHDTQDNSDEARE